MSIYDKASLVLIPSGTKTSKVFSQKPVNGDGDFTFSRSTAATRVNADGNIEKETQNLLLQSNTFSNASWTKTNSSVTAGQSGYDGGSDAWQVDISSAFAQVEQTISTSGVQTFSVYAKAGTLNWVRLRIDHSGFSGTYFDLANGAVGSTASDIDSSIEDVGGGWYRCSLSVNNSITRVRIYPAIANNDLTATSGNIYIQDAQLEQGLVARDYIETTTAAVEGGITDNVPRLDYTDSSCPALLLEPQRTNAMTYSEGLKIGLGINYTTPSVTLTPNDAESPEGYNNATKFDGALNDIADTYAGYTASTTNTFSAFLKAGTCDIARMRHTATGSNAEITINLTSGTITSTTGAQYLDSSIVDYGNGWYRASITFTSGTTAYITRVQLAEAGYIHMYGWQIERGASYPTSYIPTYGTSVTRNQEICSKTSISSLIGQTEGVVYFEWDYQNVGSSGGNIIMSLAGASLQELYFWVKTDGTYVYDVYDSTKQAGITGTIGSFGIKKIALAYKNNDFALYINGVLVGSDTSGSVPTLTDVYIGRYAINTNYNIASGINQALLFKTRLSNAELAALTTI